MQYKWYITFHGGTENKDLNNIHAFSADGKRKGKALEKASLPASVSIRELRGLVFGPDGDLYLANAYHEFSQVIRFHGEQNKDGLHVFKEVFVQSSPTANPGIDHPFSVAFGPQGDLFVTSQNTNLTLRYHGPRSMAGKPGTPMPLPSALAELKGHTFAPGTFCASTKEVPDGLICVRKAMVAAGTLFVVDRDADGVRKYDPDTGAFRGLISASGLIDKPINLAVADGFLYIGNRGNESVAKYDLHNGKVTPFIAPKAGGLNNPSGIAIGPDGFIYVGSRGTKQVLRYHLADGRADKHPFIDDLEDEPEFIEMAPF